MGGKYLGRNVDALAVGGRLVIIGMQGGTKAELDIGEAAAASGPRCTPPTLRSRPADRPRRQGRDRGRRPPRRLARRRARASIRPIVDRRLPMSRAGEAHAVVEASEHIGKVLLLPED